MPLGRKHAWDHGVIQCIEFSEENRNVLPGVAGFLAAHQTRHVHERELLVASLSSRSNSHRLFDAKESAQLCGVGLCLFRVPPELADAVCRQTGSANSLDEWTLDDDELSDYEKQLWGVVHQM